MLKAPFPYTGGKSSVAAEILKRFGPITTFLDPFCGSTPVLLAAKEPFRREIINDRNGYVVNAWRAIQRDPEETAYWADNPTFHLDLTARQRYLIRWAHAIDLPGKLEEDPDFFDAKCAGWWIWGVSCWISPAHFCKTKKDTIQASGGKSRPHVTAGQGVQAQTDPEWEGRPHINHDEYGRGIKAQTEKVPRVRHNPSGAGVTTQRANSEKAFRVYPDSYGQRA